MGDTPWFGSTICLISTESKPIYRDSLAFVAAARSRAGITRGIWWTSRRQRSVNCFVVRSIAGTRQAYNLEGPSVEEREFAVSDKPLSREDLDLNASTLRDARIWDWRALEPQLQPIQGLRPYYTFAGVDIDRYMIDGVERQVMITARELEIEKLPSQARVWVNLALKYTHGYGAVVGR